VRQQPVRPADVAEVFCSGFAGSPVSPDPLEDDMAKSARRNQTEGTLDRIAGRVLEMIGKLTGRTSTKAKGKGARFRGSARSTKGRTKRVAH
jgi:uncharacterized protein YjbJ (UPF0337 family)